MDENTRNEIAEIILKTLLEEILRDGKIEPAEKEVFQKLFSALKVEKSKVTQIHQQVLRQIKGNEREGALDMARYFSSLHESLTEKGFEPKVIKGILERVGRILGVDSKLFQSTLPAAKPKILDEKAPSKSPQNVAREAQEIDPVTPGETTGEPSLQKWSTDWISTIDFGVGGVSKKAVQKVLKFREMGALSDAKRLLLDYSTPLDYDLRYILLERVCAEMDEEKLAREFLEKAKKSGTSQNLIDYEGFFLDCRAKTAEECFEHWLGLPEHENLDDLAKQQSLRDLARAWESRFQMVFASHLLESCGEDLECAKFLGVLRSRVFEDIYFRYYGRTIMLIQLLASVLVLSICFYNIGYIGPAVKGILVGIVAGLPDPSIFLEHLGKVMPFFFLVIALVPVAYINGLMLFASFQSDVLSYTEAYPHFVKICNFGRIYHLAVNESDKPLFLYQDDNDYTYISLVRHLPFVPNFTYIYGFDRLRGFHCLLPLYGVADGYLFGKRYFSGSARQSLPINMLGVRLGQAATGIAHISSSILFSIPAILVAIAFFAMYISYSAEASIEAYAVSFTAFLAALVAFYAFPWIALKIMTTRFLSFPFTANIIKPGLLFLAGAYLFRHYAVYSYAGVLPSLCGLLTFYLLFVRTKYPPEKKQIVAQVSSLNNLPDSKSRVTDLPQGLKALYLGKEMTRSRNKLHLFYNDEYVVLTRKVLGMTLYYDVINLTTAFKISLMEIPGGTRLRVSTYNFDIHESVSELQKACEAASLPGEITTFKEPNRSKIPLNQLGVLASLWVLWQFAIVFAHPGYTPVESPASTKYLDTAVKNLVTTGNHWTHRQEGVSYSKSIDLEKKEIVFWHKNSVTWEEFEEAVRRKSSAAAVGPTTRALPSPESSEFLLPSFIKKDGFRDDVIEFLGWQLLTRWQRVDPLRYGQELEVYCKNFGAVALNRAKDLICAFPFRFEDALQWIRTEKKVPEIFDIEIIRELAGIDGGILAFSPALARLDRETLVRGVSMNGMFLQYAAPELRRDKRLVMMAINQDYNAYRFMDPIFYRDGVIVSKLVEHDGMLLKHASENLKKKRSLVLKAAIQNYQAYQFMDPEFWKDREICMHLLTKDGLLLEYLDKDLRDEDRLVKVAIMQNGKALQFATERYKKDRSIASLALQNDPSAWIFLDPDLYEHRDLAIQMLRMDGLQLENLSEKFRREPDVVLVAIEQNFRAFLSMDSSLWRDRRVVAKILEKQGLALEFVDEELRKDRQLLLTALEQNGLSLEFVPVDLRSDRDLILTAVNSNGEGLRFAPRKARRDLEIVLAAARQNLNALRYGYLSEEWMIAQSDKDNPMAQVCLGYHFMEGIRFSKNANRARELLTRAAERGLSLAQRTLAFLYLNSPRGRGDLDRAWKWLEAAAEQGDLEAMTRIGQLHEQGMAVFKDVSKALKWYLKAAELGYPQAQYLVGKVLDVYPDSDLKPSNPIYWYEHSAESGYLLSQIILGERYFLGNGVEVNSSRAVSWFAQAGRRGDTSSQVHLGVLYGHGIGVEKSWTKAVDWFEQSMRNGVEFPGCLIARGSPKTSGPGAGVALKTWFLEEAEKGDATAQCVIGVMLEKGEWETKSNPEEAYSWFQKSAQSGNPEGQNRLGMAYLRGMGIDRNSEEAFQWFQMAANTGYSSAQTNLGKVLEKGVGVIKDEAKAVEWYRKAAIQDHAEAQVSLGTLYELGRGVNRDYSQATSWYEKAAIQGHAAAQTNLGMMYEFGKGIQKSEESAIQWYRKAALQKDQRAIRTLKFMKERGVFIEDGY